MPGLTVAALLARALVVLAFTSAESHPCRRSLHGRSLTQAPPPTSEVTANSSNVTLNDISTVDGLTTVSIDVVALQCTVVSHARINITEGSGTVLQSPLHQHTDTAQDCCVACQEYDGCNVWQWCPRSGGCLHTTTAPAAGGPGAQAGFPHGGCQLLHINGFSPFLMNSRTSSFQNAEFPFVAGAPVNLTVSQIAGFSINAGSDLGSQYDYACPKSIDPAGVKCVLAGAAKVGGAACLKDAACQAFAFFPHGIAFDGSGPVSVLKSGGDAGVTVNSTYLNPTAVVYLEDDSSLDLAHAQAALGASQTTTIVVSTVLGSAALLVAVTGAYCLRRHRRALRSPGGAAGGGAAEVKPVERTGAGEGGGLQWQDSSGTEEGTPYKCSSDGSRSSKLRVQRSSPPSVVDATSGSSGGSGARPLSIRYAGGAGANFSPFALHVSGAMYGGTGLVVSEPPPSGVGEAGASGGWRQGRRGSGSGPSGTAQELLEVFSRMYQQRPAVDFNQLVGMLEEAGSASDSDAAHAQESASASTGAVVTPPEGGAAGAPDAEAADATADAWLIRPEDVEMCRRPDGTLWQLGSGAFGTVYKAVYRAPRRGARSVAVKVLHRLEDPRHAGVFVHEAAMLRALDNEHVVAFLGAGVDGPQGTAMLVTELMELGDLWRALPARSPAGGERVFAWRRRGSRVMADVARGLLYLHSNRVVHLDLKSANILLARGGAAKIADVGMARVLHKSCLSALSGMGTFAWSAPEVLAGRRCTEKADIFSYGVVLWEVCTGEAPVRGDMRALRVPEDCPAEVADLYLRCTAEDPARRPTAVEIVETLTALPDDGTGAAV